jgi:TrkA domain protein
MAELTETPMPGFGIRWGMSTRAGRSLAVISHQTGRRDLVVYDREDPDAAAAAVELSEDEAHTVAELLGGSRIVERLDDLAMQVEGLAIEWLKVGSASSIAGQPLSESQVRTRTGASIVALVRDGTAIPSPGADDVVVAGDTAVIVGDRQSASKLAALLDARDPGSE